MSGSDGHYSYVGNHPQEVETAGSELGHLGSTLLTLAGDVERDTASIKDAWPKGHTGQVAAQDASHMGRSLDECHQAFSSAALALEHLHPQLVKGRRDVDDLNDSYRVLSAQLSAQTHPLEDFLYVDNNSGGRGVRLPEETRRQKLREEAHHDLQVAQSRAGYASLADIDIAYKKVVGQVTAESDHCNNTLRGLTDGGRAPAGHGHAEGETRYDVSFSLLSASAAPQVADILSGRTPFPTDAKAVHDAWLELSADQQAHLLNGDPARFGNLNGVPVKDRDTANHFTLQNQIDRVERSLKRLGMTPTTDPEHLDSYVYYDSHKRGQLERASGMTVDEVKHALILYSQLKRDGVPSQLLAYEPGAYGGKGRAAIAFGDVDNVNNVAFCVPGLMSSLGNVSQVSGDALHLFEQANQADPGQTAVVAWQGYDAPNFLEVPFQDKAEAGAKLLAADVNAMRITHDGPIEGKLTVVGHSYGSTTTGLALQHDHMNVDQVALIGSPGVGGDAQTSADLGLDERSVFVGSASHDLVSTVPDSLGQDPSEDTFDATRFEAESPDRGYDIKISDHSRYYQNQSESLYNLADIVIGHGDRLRQEGMLAQPRHVVHEQAMDDSGPYDWVDDKEASRIPTTGHDHANDPESLRP